MPAGVVFQARIQALLQSHPNFPSNAPCLTSSRSIRRCLVSSAQVLIRPGEPVPGPAATPSGNCVSPQTRPGHRQSCVLPSRRWQRAREGVPPEALTGRPHRRGQTTRRWIRRPRVWRRRCWENGGVDLGSWKREEALVSVSPVRLAVFGANDIVTRGVAALATEHPGRVRLVPSPLPTGRSGARRRPVRRDAAPLR